MRGKHTVTVRNRKVQFTLELERNITIIRGDSATGKTTLIGMLRDYEMLGDQSGVTIKCDKPCPERTDVPVSAETIAVQTVTPAEGPSFGIAPSGK